MAYIVKTRVNNGYRCGCCSYTWENAEVVETLEEALAAVPTEPRTVGKDGDELEKVKVIDGATNELIAWGKLSWPITPQKGDLYSATRWQGEKNGVPFDTHSKEEWEEVIRSRHVKYYERKVEEAEAEVKKARQALERYMRGNDNA